MALTPKQRAFVEAYTGNATEAAIKAGYSEKTAAEIGKENLRKPYIQKAIQERETKRLAPTIANREERLTLLTRIMRNEDEATKERLKAIELLGKAEGDFLERVEHSGDVGLNLQAQIHAVLLRQAKEERASAAETPGT